MTTWLSASTSSDLETLLSTALNKPMSEVTYKCNIFPQEEWSSCHKERCSKKVKGVVLPASPALPCRSGLKCKKGYCQKPTKVGVLFLLFSNIL